MKHGRRVTAGKYRQDRRTSSGGNRTGMPIKVADNSPAERILNEEGVEIIRDKVALRQDIRPLRILLLNLMPAKIATEVQIARLLSHTPLQIELNLLAMSSYQPANTPREHLQAFYRQLNDIWTEYFDGLIVTGAPVEHLEFEEVAYWPEMVEVLAWAREHVFRQFHICWGAQAALYSRYGIGKVKMPKKLFGIYEQTVTQPAPPLLRGFPDRFPAPVSRYTGTDRAEIERHPELRILVDSPETGPCLIEERDTGDIYMFNHLEYDTTTLADEYRRDLQKFGTMEEPANYFLGEGAARGPANRWRPYGYLLFSNWTSLLYRDTPYNLQALGSNRG
jgi:homoserine O-succinyltransferase/O-acetyltransferase